MDEFIAFVRDRNSPTAAVLTFVQESTMKLCRHFIGSALGRSGIRQINPFLIPDELILGSKVEIIAGHRSPLSS
jgi:hypothetical protein